MDITNKMKTFLQANVAVINKQHWYQLLENLVKSNLDNEEAYNIRQMIIKTCDDGIEDQIVEVLQDILAKEFDTYLPGQTESSTFVYLKLFPNNCMGLEFDAFHQYLQFYQYGYGINYIDDRFTIIKK